MVNGGSGIDRSRFPDMIAMIGVETMNYVKKAFLVGMMLLSCGFVFADARDFSEVMKKVQDKVTVEQLQLRSEDNKIVLEGRVGLLKDKVAAEKIVQKEFKKQELTNNIIVSTISEKTDEDITLDVITQIQRDAPQRLDFDALGVTTHGGNVTLTGKVRNANLYDVAEEAAMKTEGVRSVDNRIDVLPPSQMDDRLRVNIQNRLRNDDRLFYYFMGAQPSIIIIVEGSRVTLAGNVDTESDRILAGSLVRQMSGVLSVQNLLVVN